jgi:hypothetical protein
MITGIVALTSAGMLSLGFDIWQTTRADHQLSIEAHEAKFGDSYDALSRDYLRFLELCLEHPEAYACLSQSDEQDLDTLAEQKRAILYEYLFSVFERAYLHHDLTEQVRSEIWPGWDAYIGNFLERQSFREIIESWRYEDGSLGMNPRFEAYLNEKLSLL